MRDDIEDWDIDDSEGELSCDTFEELPTDDEVDA
jgi:hypothetical protein